MKIWVSPSSTSIPLTESPVRFAVGTPSGMSSYSWRVWIHGSDTYVMCRDNYREFKVSLHSTGIWRLGLTEKAVSDRPDLVAEGADRAWKKWTPGTGDAGKAVVAFRIVFLSQSLFLQPADRTDWRPSIMFVEPPEGPETMTFVSVVVVRSHAPLVGPDIDGGIIAVVPLDDISSIQLVAQYESRDALWKSILDSFPSDVNLHGLHEEIPDRGVLFLHGDKDVGSPWVTAVPYSLVGTVSAFAARSTRVPRGVKPWER